MGGEKTKHIYPLPSRLIAHPKSPIVFQYVNPRVQSSYSMWHACVQSSYSLLNLLVRSPILIHNPYTYFIVSPPKYIQLSFTADRVENNAGQVPVDGLRGRPAGLLFGCLADQCHPLKGEPSTRSAVRLGLCHNNNNIKSWHLKQNTLQNTEIISVL